MTTNNTTANNTPLTEWVTLSPGLKMRRRGMTTIETRLGGETMLFEVQSSPAALDLFRLLLSLKAPNQDPETMPIQDLMRSKAADRAVIADELANTTGEIDMSGPEAR